MCVLERVCERSVLKIECVRERDKGRDGERERERERVGKREGY